MVFTVSYSKVKFWKSGIYLSKCSTQRFSLLDFFMGVINKGASIFLPYTKLLLHFIMRMVVSSVKHTNTNPHTHIQLYITVKFNVYIQCVCMSKNVHRKSRKYFFFSKFHDIYNAMQFVWCWVHSSFLWLSRNRNRVEVVWQWL